MVEEGVEAEHKAMSGDKQGDDLESQWQDAMGSLEKVQFPLTALLCKWGASPLASSCDDADGTRLGLRLIC